MYPDHMIFWTFSPSIVISKEPNRLTYLTDRQVTCQFIRGLEPVPMPWQTAKWFVVYLQSALKTSI